MTLSFRPVVVAVVATGAQAITGQIASRIAQVAPLTGDWLNGGEPPCDGDNETADQCTHVGLRPKTRTATAKPQRQSAPTTRRAISAWDRRRSARREREVGMGLLGDIEVVASAVPAWSQRLTAEGC